MNLRLIRDLMAAPIALFLVTGLVACGGGGSAQAAGPTGGTAVAPPDTSYLSPAGSTRTWLTASELIGASAQPDSPLDNSYFMPIGSGTAPLQPFAGVIHLTSLDLATNGGPAGTTFPNVDLRFVSNGSDLIPLDRDILVPTNNPWRLILGPGTAWSEPGDNGWSRASFPFEIIEPIGVTRNGIATFVYNASQASALRVQTVMETDGATAGESYDLWATLAATYEPQSFSEAADTIAAYQAEKAAYLPWQPWSALPIGVGQSAYDNGNTQQISMAGLLYDGTLYAEPCHTRFGNYPYCQQMRAGAYSATKTMGAALSLLWLAQQYGDDVANLKIADYLAIPQDRQAAWANVSFLDALDMATGIGTNAADAPIGTGQYTFADLDSTFEVQVLYGTTGIQNMLNLALTQPGYSWGPGVEMRYENLATLELSAAMNAYYQSQAGAGADLWQAVTASVLQPIGVAHLPMMRTIETDGALGIPLLYIGLIPTLDDTAKISRLLANDGNYNGMQLLSPTLTARALYRTTDQGLRGYVGYDNTWGQSRYLMSFWSTAWSNGAGCTVRVPYMLGAGGSLVGLLPNGVIVFRYAESGDEDVDPLVAAGAQLAPMC